jgi:hypothetical protein
MHIKNINGQKSMAKLAEFFVGKKSCGFDTSSTNVIARNPAEPGMTKQSPLCVHADCFAPGGKVARALQ